MASAAVHPIAPGHYCAADRITIDEERTPLGYALMSVTIARTAHGYRVGFWNVLPDSPQQLAASSRRVTVRRDGSLFFTFTDGWGNRGSARIRPNGAVTLSETRESTGASNQIGRNYGDYRVTARACASRGFAGRR